MKEWSAGMEQRFALPFALGKGQWPVWEMH
ncbi:hypothetical protein SAMN06298214_0501 [Bacteroidales bacterium WCE2004]|nr:hypothetical protein SAMN06298214_0501 [Bacteroidales bacterium WCE2004]